MKTTFTLLTIICCSLLLYSCNNKEEPPHSKHVILIGLDGMGAYGFQRAATPCMNDMAKNGVLSIKSRCVLESSNRQNWMSMLTGAIPIQHGVTSNAWEPDNHNIEPTLKNKAGSYPSVFDDIKSRKQIIKFICSMNGKGLAECLTCLFPIKQ